MLRSRLRSIRAPRTGDDRLGSLARVWLIGLAIFAGCASSKAGVGGSGSGGSSSNLGGSGGGLGAGGSPTQAGGSGAGGSGAGGSGAVGSPTQAGGSGAVGSPTQAGGSGGRSAPGGSTGTGGALDAPDAGPQHDARDAGADSSDGLGGSTVTPPTAPQTCGTTWRNPITSGAHDPSLAKDGDAYYVYSTAESLAAGARLVPFETSTDRLHWTSLGNLLPAIPSWSASLGLTGTLEVWAPDVHLVNGKYFLYYSVSSWGDVTHSAVGLMTNTTLNPSAPGYNWVDHGKVIGSPEGGAGVNVIDPDLFVDDDGSWWLVYGSFQAGIRLVPLDPTTGLWTRTTSPVVITTSLGEGSDIIKNDGFYYLFVSRGTCCAALASTYEIVYGRASTISGPYVGKNGTSINTAAVNLLPAGSDGNPGQGGQAFFKENGQYYMVYHAYQPPSGQPILNVRPIYFDANDWVTLDPCLAKGYHP